MVQNNRTKILWDFKFQTDKQLLANPPDIVIVDEKKKTVVVIDVAIPADSNIRMKEYEKARKCKDL